VSEGATKRPVRIVLPTCARTRRAAPRAVFLGDIELVGVRSVSVDFSARPSEDDVTIVFSTAVGVQIEYDDAENAPDDV